MIADTNYTTKSGQFGSSMFSKPGRLTTFQYLCFDNLKPPILMPGQKRPPPPPDRSQIHENIVQNQTEEAVDFAGGVKEFLENMAVIEYKKREDEDESPKAKKRKRKRRKGLPEDDTSGATTPAEGASRKQTPTRHDLQRMTLNEMSEMHE
jgi:hypothetical protein